VRVAFLRCGSGIRNPVAGLINAFTGFGGFNHTEIVFSDRVSFSSLGTESSTYTDGRFKKDGTRFRSFPYDPACWAFHDFWLPPEEEWVMRRWCESELDCRYDYYGCMRYVVPFLKQHPDDWFCSEVCAAALQQVHYSPVMGIDAWRVSPNYLAKLLSVG
jgi:hypothetical protein